ncbi:MAG: hypothetical protein ABW046_21370 [Actinoplanes sp.]
MGTARLFNKILHRELDIHAAWLPATNNFAVGDYGVFSDGVFVKMGTIAEFGVPIRTAEGRPTELKFSSTGTRVHRVAGGVATSVFPQADIDAKLVVEFASENSFYLHLPKIGVQEMPNIAEVARSLRAHDDWQRRYRVVGSAYTGEGCTILSSRTAKAQVELNAEAGVLRLLELGDITAGITVGGADSAGLQVLGKTGVVGLRLFRLSLFGNPKVLGPDDEPGPEGVDDLVEFESAEEPDDDI